MQGNHARTPSAASALDWILGLLDLLGSGPVGSRTVRQCPAHEDRSPSLSLGVGEGDRVLLHCHAGCTTEEVLSALTISMTHLHRPGAYSPREHIALLKPALRFPPLETRRGKGTARTVGLRFEATHQYGPWRLLRWRDPRTADKHLEWEHLDRHGAWIPGLGGATLANLPLYEEQQVIMGAAAGETIVVVESESSVDALTQAGIYATTWAGGATSPQLGRLTGVLSAAAVLVVPDNDPHGLRCGERIIGALRAAGADVTVMVPDLPGEDPRDVLARGGVDAFTGVPLVMRVP